jgi:3-phosphoglycerate kinase
MMSYLSKVAPSRLRGIALIRLDFNTKDDWRMRAVLPTLRMLRKTSYKIVIVSHYGRPEPICGIGKKSRIGPGPKDQKFSLKKDAARLEKLLLKKVIFVPSLDFGKIRKDIVAVPKGSVLLLENLRFFAGEERNDPKFARELAALVAPLENPAGTVGEPGFYVNDAFAVSHRANASISAITKFLPSYAGLELEKEIRFLSHVMQKALHPLVLVIGGAKAGDKLGVVTYFRKKADSFLLGGGPEDTVLKLKGFDVKKSLVDRDPHDLRRLKEIIHLKKLVPAFDYVWHGDNILDIGPASAELFASIIAKAKTIIWSGPMGMVEKKPYNKGSLAVARAIAKNKKAFSLTGGGETVTFLKKEKLDRKFSFISTGGGAMLDFLSGKKLPGIEALDRKRPIAST